MSFDYSDFTNPVTITIVAVNDFVQGAHPHRDSIIVTSVTSVDSIADCEAANVSRVCAQAVAYNGFTGARAVNVSVLDNDFAGV